MSLLLHSLLWSSPAPSLINAKITENVPPSLQISLMSQPALSKTEPELKLVKEQATKKPVVKEVVTAKPVIAKKPTAVKKVAKKAPVKKTEPKKVIEKPAKPVAKKTTSKAVTETVKHNEPKTLESQTTNVAQKTSAPIFVEKPKFRVKPTLPDYPRAARRRGQQGSVLVEVWLDEKGQQVKQLIAKSSGYELLDKAAIKAVKGWQFQGHQLNGKSIASRLRVPVKFELN